MEPSSILCYLAFQSLVGKQTASWKHHVPLVPQECPQNLGVQLYHVAMLDHLEKTKYVFHDLNLKQVMIK
jgi:hypothetical protein